MVRFPWNKKQTYWLNSKPQMRPSDLTLAMTLTMNMVPSGSGKGREIQKSASRPWKSQGIWLICLKPGPRHFCECWIPFADLKLQFIDCFNHVHLATSGGPCRWAQRTGRDFETVYPPHKHSISKLEMKAHLLLVSCVGSGSQIMQCNKHVLWLAVVVVQGASMDCLSQKDCWAYQICRVCHYTEQISVLYFEIENHVASV